MAYLAVPISGRTVSEAGDQIKQAKTAGAEMLELRVDYIDSVTADCLDELLALAAGVCLPVIVTCRDAAEGGLNDLPQDLRVSILIAAIQKGADFVDCEYVNYQNSDVRTRIDEVLVDSKTRLILSAHDFNGPLPDLAGLYDEIFHCCPQAVVKLVYKANHINECFVAFDLLNNKKGDAIVLCMGGDGLISRVLAKKYGSLVTFASLSDAESTAPGQLAIKELKELYRWDHIDADTKVFGVIGSPVAHSLSPAIFNACFDEQGLNAVYLPILVKGEKESFNEFMGNIECRDAGFAGFSVTIPHKAHALDYVEQSGDYLEPLAATIGAVNTLKIGFGGLVSGFNTDYAGAMDALLSAMGIGKHGLHNVKAAVLGAGGVARAIVAGLTDVGAKVLVYNRTVAKAKSLAEEFKCGYASIEEAAAMDAGVVINCTSIGMHPKVDASPAPAESIKSDMVVFDTVYNPLDTLLLKYAKDAGAKTVTGAEMFVRQAMAQYKIFTGKDADEELMRQTVLKCLVSDDKCQMTETCFLLFYVWSKGVSYEGFNARCCNWFCVHLFFDGWICRQGHTRRENDS
ncbi:MAG: shikimate dehydrogenase [Planctomycetes bacterium]|nr:shikimate dehydrogenase [Planctomycetota bacterium]